jgi:hypothetical protein
MQRRLHLRRRVAGALWLSAWCALLYLVAAPWRELGGLVSERLRWLEWFVLWNGLAVGYVLGRAARDMVTDGSGRTYAGLMRVMLYPPLAVSAMGLVLLTLRGQRDPVGVVVTALLAYWAGMDVAFGAVPLLEGKPAPLREPLAPPVESDRDDESLPE